MDDGRYLLTNILEMFSLHSLENSQVPCIFLIDGHRTHVTYQLSELCSELGIIFVSIKWFYSIKTQHCYSHRHPSMATCFSLFWTIFRPIFSSRRYNRCALYVIGSHTVYRVCVKTIIKVIKFKTLLNRV